MIIDHERLAKKMLSIASAISKSKTGAADKADLDYVSDQLEELLDLLRDVDGTYVTFNKEEAGHVDKLIAVSTFIGKIKSRSDTGDEKNSCDRIKISLRHPETPIHILGLRAAAKSVQKLMALTERERKILQLLMPQCEGEKIRLTGPKIIKQYFERFNEELVFENLRGRELSRLKRFKLIDNDSDENGRGYFILPSVLSSNE